MTHVRHVATALPGLAVIGAVPASTPQPGVAVVVRR
jgi:hypothetical protein